MVNMSGIPAVISLGLFLVVAHALPSDSGSYTATSSYRLELDTNPTSFASSSTNGSPMDDSGPSDLPPLIHHPCDDDFASGEPGIGSPEDDDASIHYKQHNSRESAQRKRQASLTSDELRMKELLEAHNRSHTVEPSHRVPDEHIDPQLRGGGPIVDSKLKRVTTYNLGDKTGITPDTFGSSLTDVFGPRRTDKQEYDEGWRKQAKKDPLEQDDDSESEGPDPMSRDQTPLELQQTITQMEQTIWRLQQTRTPPAQTPARETPTSVQVESQHKRPRAPRIKDFYKCVFVKADGIECGKPHHTQAALNHHQKNHAPKDFKCDEGDCTSSFSVRDQLAKHQRTVHAPANKYECELCNHRTNRRDVWVKHTKTAKHRQKVHGSPVIHQI